MPAAAALMACTGGIRHPTIARMIESTSAVSAAFGALTLKTPSSTNSSTIGMAATSADSTKDPKTGSSSCWNMRWWPSRSWQPIARMADPLSVWRCSSTRQKGLLAQSIQK